MMPDDAWIPLVVVTVRSRARMEAEARWSRSTEHQDATIRWWLGRQGRAPGRTTVLPRTRARYRPAGNAELIQIVERAKATGGTLVMDDVFRFIDGCNEDEARGILEGLVSLEAPLFSIAHGALFSALSGDTMAREVARRAIDFHLRSRRAKAAAADPANPQREPSAKARRTAARTRRLVADATARRLVAEIERVRAALPPEKGNNLSAIAAALNADEVPTPSGRGRWQGTTVKRVLARAGRLADR